MWQKNEDGRFACSVPGMYLYFIGIKVRNLKIDMYNIKLQDVPQKKHGLPRLVFGTTTILYMLICKMTGTVSSNAICVPTNSPSKIFFNFLMFACSILIFFKEQTVFSSKSMLTRHRNHKHESLFRFQCK